MLFCYRETTNTKWYSLQNRAISDDLRSL